MTYKNAMGETLYPVCAMNGNQHIMYLAHNHISIDAMEGIVEYRELDRVERAMEAFMENVINGVVYATYRDSLLIKSYLNKYKYIYK